LSTIPLMTDSDGICRLSARTDETIDPHAFRIHPHATEKRLTDRDAERLLNSEDITCPLDPAVCTVSYADGRLTLQCTGGRNRAPYAYAGIVSRTAHLVREMHALVDFESGPPAAGDRILAY